ncbi:hypothetical protein ACP70R_011713 [Stipagrostis hirtigluma subsp. patula]
MHTVAAVRRTSSPIIISFPQVVPAGPNGGGMEADAPTTRGGPNTPIAGTKSRATCLSGILFPSTSPKVSLRRRRAGPATTASMAQQREAADVPAAAPPAAAVRLGATGVEAAARYAPALVERPPLAVIGHRGRRTPEGRVRDVRETTLRSFKDDGGGARWPGVAYAEFDVQLVSFESTHAK